MCLIKHVKDYAVQKSQYRELTDISSLQLRLIMLDASQTKKLPFSDNKVPVHVLFFH
jgi:hypothetical protein